MYDIYARLRDERGIKDIDVCKATGIAPGSMTDWKKGRANLKTDKLLAIARYFNVSLEFLLGETQRRQFEEYYLDAETAKEAQQMFDDPDMRALFHMKRNMNPERFKAHKKMMADMYRLEHPEDDYDLGD